MKTSYLPWAIIGVSALAGCSSDSGSPNQYPPAGSSTGGAYVYGTGGATYGQGTHTGVTTFGGAAGAGQGGALVGNGGATKALSGTAVVGGATSSVGGTKATGGAGGATGGTKATGGGAAGGTKATGGSAATGGAALGGVGNCPAVAAGVLSDFESGKGSLYPQPQITSGTVNGYWFSFKDATGCASAAQVPTAVTDAAVNAEALATTDARYSTCNRFAMHSSITGCATYSGFGAALSPTAGSDIRKAVDVSGYDGVSFWIKAGSGTQGPIYVEFQTKECVPGLSWRYGCESGNGHVSVPREALEHDSHNLDSGFRSVWYDGTTIDPCTWNGRNFDLSIINVL